MISVILNEYTILSMSFEVRRKFFTTQQNNGALLWCLIAARFLPWLQVCVHVNSTQFSRVEIDGPYCTDTNDVNHNQ